ncbi:MAG: hypothetical protein OK404_02745, partial [Thaumarchaeota archaeon]|nr:hypothetical protein [Nitrososphaerota archaeon]
SEADLDRKALPKMGIWELLGQLLTAGSATFGIIYATPGLTVLTGIFRGGVVFTTGPEASLGLAGLALTSLGSFAAIVIGQLRSPGGSIGALLIFWTAFAVNVLGDVLFYSAQPMATTVMLVGLASAFLTILGLSVIAQRPLGAVSGQA